MTSLVYTEGFVQDAAQVYSSSKRTEIRETIDLLAVVPTMGSTAIPSSIKKLFGASVRKLVISPFLVIYEYTESENTVTLLGMMHEKTAW
ncbi:MAG: type II toxin-antitoxin system RelE/ParE family toxin [Raoultibacter sp.]